MAHNCHGKSINLTAKRITSRQKEKDSRQKEKDSKQKENLTEKTHGKIFLMPRGHFNSYFFCREVVVILFAVSLFLFAVWFFFLPWGFSFCREVILFAARLFFLPWAFSFCREVNSFCREVFLFAVSLFSSFNRVSLSFYVLHNNTVKASGVPLHVTAQDVI